MSAPTKNVDPVARQRDRERFEALKAELGSIGFFRRGNLVRVMVRCGKTNCGCAQDPRKRHGPYVQWVRRVRGKTVSVRVRPADLELYQQWLDNTRQLDRLLKRMQALSLRATERLLRRRP